MNFVLHTKVASLHFLVCLLLIVVGANVCLAQEEQSDVIRIYWNPELTEIYDYTADGPDTVTAYIVLENPSASGPSGRCNLYIYFDQASVLSWTSDIGTTADHGTFWSVSFTTPDGFGDRTVLGTFELVTTNSQLQKISFTAGTVFLDSNFGALNLSAPYYGTYQCAWLNPGTPQVSFRNPVLDLGARGYGASSTSLELLFNDGDAPLFLTPEFLQNCEYFSLYGPGTYEVIAPNAVRTISFEFLPTEIGVYTCQFSIAPGIELTLNGVGEEWRYSLTGAGSYNFDSTAVGGIDEMEYEVTNSGNVPVTVYPVFSDSCHGMRASPRQEPVLLGPGRSTNVEIEFLPTEPIAYQCDAVFGDSLLVLSLSGSTFEGVDDVRVNRTELDFVYVGVGFEKQMVFYITNWGEVLYYPEFQFGGTSGAFSFVAPPDLVVRPGRSIGVYVRFSPLKAGIHQGALSIGGDLPIISLVGVAATQAFDLRVIPDRLVFEPTNPGETDTQMIEVTNRGYLSQIVELTSISPLLTELPAAQTVASGETISFPVTYRPFEYGRFDFRIVLNDEHELFIDCIGTPVLDFEPSQNLIGFYFDADHSLTTTIIEAEAQSVTAYLAMTQPSDVSGMGGWECNIKTSAGAALVNYSLSGNAINASSGYEFTVGLGLEPLPYSSDVLLGSFDFVVFDLEWDEFRLELTPTDTPSIPGMMSWVAWDDFEKIIPMIPFTGDSTVAWIRTTENVATEMTTPLVVVREGAIELSWPNSAEAYHVYRRLDAGQPVQLTPEPLVGIGTTMTYLDEDLSFGAGAVLNYSYRAVVEGIEVGESPEAEISYGGQLPKQTRLTANYPNPFNPQTTISFDLAKPSQVRIDIYDVTGRRVRQLENAHFAAGTFGTIWTGQNDEGQGLPSGAYYVRMTTDTQVDTHKVMLLK